MARCSGLLWYREIPNNIGTATCSVEVPMPRRSSLDKLEPAVRDALVARIESDRYTIAELLDWLRSEHGVESISRSAMGRLVARVNRRRQAVKLMSEALAEDGNAGNDEAVELMLQLAQLRLREARIIERLRELGVG